MGMLLRNHTYMLGNLVGKGGQSEVFRAYDLENFHEVAIKIFEVKPNMDIDQADFYVRHALREADIQNIMGGRSVAKFYTVCAPLLESD